MKPLTPPRPARSPPPGPSRSLRRARPRIRARHECLRAGDAVSRRAPRLPVTATVLIGHGVGSTVDAGAGGETVDGGRRAPRGDDGAGRARGGRDGCRRSRRAPGLVVDYTLTNTGTKPVLAYDVVPADLGSATLPADVDAKHAWVYEQSGVLRLSKQGFAPGPNVRFAAAPVMGGHTIAPGASITGKAYAVSPPTLDVPSESFEAPRTPVDPGVKQWQLCVQVDDRAGAGPSVRGRRWRRRGALDRRRRATSSSAPRRRRSRSPDRPVSRRRRRSRRRLGCSRDGR